MNILITLKGNCSESQIKIYFIGQTLFNLDLFVQERQTEPKTKIYTAEIIC